MYDDVHLNEDDRIWSEIKRDWSKWPKVAYERVIIHAGTARIHLTIKQFEELKRSVSKAPKVNVAEVNADQWAIKSIFRKPKQKRNPSCLSEPLTKRSPHIQSEPSETRNPINMSEPHK